MARTSVRVKFTEDHETNSAPADKMKFKKDQVCHFAPERARFFVNRGVAVALDDMSAQDEAEVPEGERGQVDKKAAKTYSNLKEDNVGPASETPGRTEPNETGGVKTTQPGAEGEAGGVEPTNDSATPAGGQKATAGGQKAPTAGDGKTTAKK